MAPPRNTLGKAHARARHPSATRAGASGPIDTPGHGRPQFLPEQHRATWKGHQSATRSSPRQSRTSRILPSNATHDPAADQAGAVLSGTATARKNHASGTKGAKKHDHVLSLQHQSTISATAPSSAPLRTSVSSLHVATLLKPQQPVDVGGLGDHDGSQRSQDFDKLARKSLAQYMAPVLRHNITSKVAGPVTDWHLPTAGSSLSLQQSPMDSVVLDSARSRRGATHATSPAEAIRVVKMSTGTTLLVFIGALLLARWFRWPAKRGGRVSKSDSRRWRELVAQSSKLGWMYTPCFCMLGVADHIQIMWSRTTPHSAFNADGRHVYMVGLIGGALIGTALACTADTTLGSRRGVSIVAAASSVVGSCLRAFAPADEWILFGGNIATGVSSALMYSVFDSWLVQQHTEVQRLGGGDLLASIFAWRHSILQICTVSVYVMLAHVLFPAHASGVAAMTLSPTLTPGLTAGTLSLIAMFSIACVWPASSPEKAADPGLKSQQPATSREPFLLCGIASFGIDLSGWLIWLLWVPALQAMLGTAQSTPMISSRLSVESGVFFSFALSAAAGAQCLLLGPYAGRGWFLASVAAVGAVCWTPVVAEPTSFSALVSTCCCVLFTWGLLTPALHAIKAAKLPDRSRASIYALFRVPTALVITCILYMRPNIRIIATLCALSMASSAICIAVLVHRAPLLAGWHSSDPMHAGAIEDFTKLLSENGFAEEARWEAQVNDLSWMSTCDEEVPQTVTSEI